LKLDLRPAGLAVSVRDQKTASGGAESDKTMHIHNDSTQIMEHESLDSVSFSDDLSIPELPDRV
jgi:hypothetical protein